MESKDEVDESNTITTVTDCLALQDNNPSKTLFSLLEDKNHLIKCLKKQLENQKLQIKFYMQQHLHNPKMIEFSKSCYPETVEENIPLALAMGNFRKRAGIKSKIYQLYQQMNEVYRTSKNNLDNQEYVLKKFFSNLYLLYPNFHTSSSSISEDSTNLIRILNDPRQIILMNNVLDSTIDLKRILQHFKVTCERLINIEEERNDIIHQTLAMSTNEKLSFNMTINTNLENIKLRKEIERIKELNRPRESLNDFASIEKQLSDLHNQIGTFFSTDETSKIYNMLDNLNEEAKSLLDSTKNIGQNEKKDSDDSAARKFFKNIGSDQERHTFRVEYAQKEVKETKSIFHAKFYNSTESDNEVKFYSKGKQKNFFKENNFKSDTWTGQIFENTETFSKHKATLLKDYREMIQQSKTKDEQILKLKNLTKNLNDKINFMQAIIDKQNEQLQQQETLTRFLIKMHEGTSHFKNQKQVAENVQYLQQNVIEAEEGILGKTGSEILENITVSNNSVQENFFEIKKHFANKEQEIERIDRTSPTLGVFSEKQPKFRSLTKTVGLPIEFRKISRKKMQSKQRQNENVLDESELFKDVSCENIPTVCKTISRKAIAISKQCKDSKNLIEAEKWKRGEYTVENEVNTTTVSTESYCTPFEKI